MTKSGGLTSRNTREGFRTEYLGEYVFSAFGTAVRVPQENDVGIDLLCNLTDFEPSYILVKSAYGVQIKSRGSGFRYAGKQATEWLSNLEFPLLLADIGKEEANVKIYSTWNLNRYLLGLYGIDQANYPDQIEFQTSTEDGLANPDCSRGLIPVGKPILDFAPTDVDSPDSRNKFRKIIAEWLSFDNENYQLRRAGVSRVFGYVNWTTNESLERGQRGWDMRYYFSPRQVTKAKKTLVEIFNVLGLYCKGSFASNISQTGFRDEFNDLRSYSQSHLSDEMNDEARDIFRNAL